MRHAKMVIAILMVTVFSVPAWAETTTHPAKATMESHFTAAREHLQKDKMVAALDIRSAAAILKKEEMRATGTAKTEIEKSTQELEKLAQDVEKGTVSEARHLEQAFTKAREAHQHNHHKIAQ